MNLSDLAPYDCSTASRQDEVAMVQIVELFQAGYISLGAAKGLAKQYTPELYQRVAWHTLRRTPLITKGYSV